MNRQPSSWDVIVPNAAGRIGYSLLRSLGRGGLRVGLGVDSDSAMGAYSRYCAGTFLHPAHERDPRGFVDAVRHAILAHRPAVYMPAGEDAFVLAEHASILRDLPAHTLLPPFATLQRLHDKYHSFRLAESLGIPTPATLQPDSLADIEAFASRHPGPLVMKSVVSSAGRGVHLLPTERLGAAVQQILLRSHLTPRDVIVQEFIDAPGYGVSLLFDRGQLKASFTHRRLRERSPRGGPSTLRQSTRQPALEAHARRMLEHVGYHGVAMLEFKHDERTGRSWFLEVNPRWWGSLELAIRSGVDFPLLFYRQAVGESVPAADFKTGITVRWLLGDLLALYNQTRFAARPPRLRELFPRVHGHDDAHFDDPLPLVAEFVLHLKRIVRRRIPRPAPLAVDPLADPVARR